jgi:hypothetical protein
VVAGVVAVVAAAMGLPMVIALAAVTFVGGFIPYIGASSADCRPPSWRSPRRVSVPAC